MRLSCGSIALLLAFAGAIPAVAKPLIVANVAAPDINCVFNSHCTVIVRDSLATVGAPGITGTGPWQGYGPAVLQSRTYLAEGGTAAAGETAYEYRLVMSDAVGTACVNALKLSIGPLKRHKYDASGKLADIFVVTRGGIGTIGLKSAEADGDVVTFTFEKPVCAGPANGKGGQSFFFGFAAAGSPQLTHGAVQLVGGKTVPTDARVPQH